MVRSRPVLLVLGALLVAPSPSAAWVYPEHRGITLIAIQRLDSQRSLWLDSLWTMAHRAYPERLSPVPADTSQKDLPRAIDLGAWPAISGDHSCSAENMLHTVLESSWILDVAEVAARLNEGLASATTRAERTNALRGSDLDLLNADPEYVARAGANNVHFLLPQSVSDSTLAFYMRRCRQEGQELNSMAVYAWYHLRALGKASAIFAGGRGEEERVATAMAALADESYALHFLQDMFAAGHAAGTRGDASLRKGSHDYYNEHGLRAVTWDGRTTVLMGDAWMRPVDAEEAAFAVRASLQQVIDAAFGELRPDLTAGTARSAPDTLNTCLLMTMPAGESSSLTDSLLAAVLRHTPIPGLPSGKGELPRFRAEVGGFLGVATAARAGITKAGFLESQGTSSLSAGLEISVRLGVGLEGVMNESGDGLAFIDLGFRQDRASTAKYTSAEVAQEAAEIAAAIPGRPSITARLRLPFYLLPLDMLLATPLLLFTSPSTLEQMGVRAANGGLIPWQAGVATPVGRFQMVAGREIGMTFYGYINERDGVVVPVSDYIFTVVALRSIQLDFPILEYRPFHLFASTQSSGLVVQFYTAVELPQEWDVVSPPGAERPALKPMWHFGLRAAFDWRHYF